MKRLIFSKPVKLFRSASNLQLSLLNITNNKKNVVCMNETFCFSSDKGRKDFTILEILDRRFNFDFLFCLLFLVLQTYAIFERAPV